MSQSYEMVEQLKKAVAVAIQTERTQRLLMEEKLIELLEQTCLKVERGLN